MNIQHSSRTDRWFTPPDILERAKRVLGPIHLDPASEVLANKAVGAVHYYDAKDDGLTKEWPDGCTVWLNPPGGRRGNKSMTGLFWTRLMHYRAAGHLVHGIFMAFSAEAIQNTQRKGIPSVGQFPVCIPAKRLRFVSPAGVPGLAPSHSNAIVYVPGSVDHTELFIETFSDVGDIMLPARPAHAA